MFQRRIFLKTSYGTQYLPMLRQPIFQSVRDLNEKLGALRLVASSYQHSGAVPRSIRIKSPRFSVSTEPSCTEPSSQWFRKGLWRREKQNRAEQFTLR